jgi:uncharacterized membrane protein
LTLLLYPLLAACSSAGDSGLTCDREPALTFDNFGEAFLAKHCTGCHSVLHEGDLREGAPVGVDLNTYADVLTWASRIEARALESLDMPPGGGPSVDERALLEEWLHCGVYPDIEALESE